MSLEFFFLNCLAREFANLLDKKHCKNVFICFLRQIRKIRKYESWSLFLCVPYIVFFPLLNRTTRYISESDDCICDSIMHAPYKTKHFSSSKHLLLDIFQAPNFQLHLGFSLSNRYNLYSFIIDLANCHKKPWLF